jgi:hypothetical protein
MQDLYGAKLFNEVLIECDRADADPRFSSIRPQSLYMRWVSAQQLNQSNVVDHVREQFLALYPNHVFGAEMRLAKGLQMAARGDYQSARNELAIIESRYPTAPIIPKVRRIMQNLQALDETQSENSHASSN